MLAWAPAHGLDATKAHVPHTPMTYTGYPRGLFLRAQDVWTLGGMGELQTGVSTEGPTLTHAKPMGEARGLWGHAFHSCFSLVSSSPSFAPSMAPSLVAVQYQY